MSKNAKRSMSSVRYRATYIETGETIYVGRPRGNLIGELPLGTVLISGTFNRTDSGDPFESTIGITPTRRRILIERERKQTERTA